MIHYFEKYYTDLKWLKNVILEELITVKFVVVHFDEFIRPINAKWDSMGFFGLWTKKHNINLSYKSNTLLKNRKRWYMQLQVLKP